MAPIVRIKGGVKGDLCEIWKKINEAHLECWGEASSIDQLVGYKQGGGCRLREPSEPLYQSCYVS